MKQLTADELLKKYKMDMWESLGGGWGRNMC